MHQRAGAADQMWVCELGLVPYAQATALQRRLCERRQRDLVPDTLLLLEHPPVLTRGRRAGAGELLHEESFYRARGVQLCDTDRGGRITYHGPGQLIGYPIMRIADVGAYLRALEAAIVAALSHEGVAARSRCEQGPDYTGVWVKQRKIASIGVHVARGVTTHGFAINVDVDLEPFGWVIACGLAGVAMTSLARELGPHARPDAARLRARVTEELCARLARQAQQLQAATLHAVLGDDGALAPSRADASQQIAYGAGARAALAVART